MMIHGWHLWVHPVLYALGKLLSTQEASHTWVAIKVQEKPESHTKQ